MSRHSFSYIWASEFLKTNEAANLKAAARQQTKANHRRRRVLASAFFHGRAYSQGLILSKSEKGSWSMQVTVRVFHSCWLLSTCQSPQLPQITHHHSGAPLLHCCAHNHSPHAAWKATSPQFTASLTRCLRMPEGSEVLAHDFSEFRANSCVRECECSHEHLSGRLLGGPRRSFFVAATA